MDIAVYGSGIMGTGMAAAFLAGPANRVFLYDRDAALVDKCMATIQKRREGQVQKGRMAPEEADRRAAALRAGAQEDLPGCALVVEAIPEDMGAKKELFAGLQPLCGPKTIFASNTSSLSLTELGQGLGRPVIGMHFFNPADAMALVEVTAGEDADAQTVEEVCRIARDIGKTPVRVQEAPGFVVNRLLIPMINEAAGLLAEGTANAADIDTAMRLGANHPMGPLALGDLVGLDTCLSIMEVLHQELGEDKYRPHLLLRKMVRAGRLGRKSGRGFFDYPQGGG